MSLDLSGLQTNLLSMASTMFNALTPVIGITAGIALGVGLAGKIISAVRSAF
ncbi:MAG: hypothetical protein IT317_13605 [Anaerolineales bacterium]|nr:hypothetical protein [Anaerolineales bacterium]